MISDPVDANAPDPNVHMGYADLFVSKDLGNQLLSISVNGTIALALLSLLGFDRVLAKSLSEISLNLSGAEWIWIIYVSVSVLILAINFYFLIRFSRKYALEKNDWSRFKDHIFREEEFRNLLNFKTKEVIKKRLPLYVVMFWMFLGLFGMWYAIDTLFVSPIMKNYSGDIFVFNYRGFLSVFLFTLYPPFIYLLLAMFIKKFQ